MGNCLNIHLNTSGYFSRPLHFCGALGLYIAWTFKQTYSNKIVSYNYISGNLFSSSLCRTCSFGTSQGIRTSCCDPESKHLGRGAFEASKRIGTANQYNHQDKPWKGRQEAKDAKVEPISNLYMTQKTLYTYMQYIYRYTHIYLFTYVMLRWEVATSIAHSARSRTKQWRKRAP